MTIPEKPQSSHQQYRLTVKGIRVKAALQKAGYGPHAPGF